MLLFIALQFKPLMGHVTSATRSSPQAHNILSIGKENMTMAAKLNIFLRQQPQDLMVSIEVPPQVNQTMSSRSVTADLVRYYVLRYGAEEVYGDTVGTALPLSV